MEEGPSGVLEVILTSEYLPRLSMNERYMELMAESSGSRELRQYLRKAFREEIPGTTKIIIAQRISSVQDADRIIVMDNGRVEAFDTHENLLKKSDLYREIYETQTSGGGDFDSPDQMKGGDAQ